MLQIEIFSYFNCFEKCKKMRPGFATASGIWCLTHTKPARSYLAIPSVCVISDHFTGRGPKVYITRALETAHRYNNVPGGLLLIEEKNTNFLTINSLNMTKTIGLLNLTAEAVKSITREQLGLTPEGEAVQLLCYDVFSQLVRGEDLSDENQELIASPRWSGVVAGFQKAELEAYQASPEFPFYHPAEVPAEDVEMTLSLITTMLGGNPTEAGSEAGSAAELLAETFGPIQTPEAFTPLTETETAEAVESLFSAEEEAELPSTEAVESLPVAYEESLPAVAGQFGLKADELQTAYDSISAAEKSIKAALAALEDQKDSITKAALRSVKEAAVLLDAKVALTESIEIEA
jgi:hypothetical protein